MNTDAVLNTIKEYVITHLHEAIETDPGTRSQQESIALAFNCILKVFEEYGIDPNDVIIGIAVDEKGNAFYSTLGPKEKVQELVQAIEERNRKDIERLNKLI